MTALITALVIILGGTWLGAPTLAALAGGIAVGLLWPGRAARTAAAAGVIAWGGVLLVSSLRGAPVLELGGKLGGAMGLPTWAPLIATLLYPAILAASAAWLAQLASPRRRTYDPRAGQFT